MLWPTTRLFSSLSLRVSKVTGSLIIIDLLEGVNNCKVTSSELRGFKPVVSMSRKRRDIKGPSSSRILAASSTETTLEHKLCSMFAIFAMFAMFAHTLEDPSGNALHVGILPIFAIFARVFVPTVYMRTLRRLRRLRRLANKSVSSVD